MQVLILGEGPTDLGRIEPDGTIQTEAVLPILVRKLMGAVASTATITVRAKEMRKIRRSAEGARQMGRSQYGYANKLAALLGLREGREADAVIAVVDRDGSRHKDRIAELNKGREELSQANKPCAVGVAIEMIEAWLLADEKALRTALGDSTIPRQPDPERLTARDEQSEQNPKGRLERLMAQSLGRPIPTSDFPNHYADIANAVEIRVLEERCPAGFCPFAEQIRALPVV